MIQLSIAEQPSIKTKSDQDFFDAPRKKIRGRGANRDFFLRGAGFYRTYMQYFASHQHINTTRADILRFELFLAPIIAAGTYFVFMFVL